MKPLTIITMSIIFIFSLFLYALTIRGVHGNIVISSIKNNLDQTTKPFELSPERGRFLLTYSLAENKSFALSKQLADAAYPDVGYYKGRFYIYFAPGISVLALPFYLIGKYFNLSQVGSFFTISLFASLTLLFIFKIAREILKLPVWASILAAFIFGFGCTSWSYAVTLYQHHVTTFFIISSFYAVFKYRQKTRWGFVWASWVWGAYGAALFLDYPNAFLMLPVMIYLAISTFQINQNEKIFTITARVSAIIASIFFIGLIVLHGYYNSINFGGWNRVSGGLVGYKTYLEQQLFSTKVDNSQKISQLETDKNPVGFFKEDAIPNSNMILLFSTQRGIFYYSPIFILALFGIWQLRKKISLEVAVLLSLVITNIFLYSSWDDPWGGWAYGPRYLIPSMPILALFVASWASSPKLGLLRRLTTFALLVYSSAIALLGVLTTNGVPPKVEAVFLKAKYDYLFNLDFLKKGQSSSFVYNQYFAHHIGLIQYYECIFAALIFLMIIVLFILPVFAAHEPKSKVK